MSVVVQCSNCGKKLKMKEPAPGKKLRCPGCKEPFVAKAVTKKRPSGGPKKKRRPAPVDDGFDDFSDDFADEGFDDQDDYGEPARPKRSAKAGGKKKKKAAAAKKSNKPLFIGVGVLGLALAGGVAFMLMSANDDTGGADVAASGDSADGAAAEDAEAGAHDAGGAHDAETDSPAGDAPNNVADAAMAATAGAATSNIDFKWLPANSEILVKLDVAKLLAGPIGELLKSPMVEQQLQGFKQQSGFGPEDIETVTIGVAGISDAAGGSQPPDPGKLPVVGVVRTKVPLDMSKVQAAIPKSMSVSNGVLSFVRLASEKPGAPIFVLWSADPQTIVFTAEESLAAVATSTESASSIDPTLLGSTSAIHFAFMPTDGDKVFRKEPVPQNSSDPTKQPMIEFGKVVQPVMSGLSLSFDLTDDMVLNGSILTASSKGAQDTAAALQKLIADTKRIQQEGTAGQVPAMMQMAMSKGAEALDAIQVRASGNSAEFSFTAPGAGQQLASMGPMLPMMVGGMMAQAQQAVAAAKPRDNLSNIVRAMHNFQQVYGRFPNAASESEEGHKLLSWRVHLLPFLNYEDLYDQFALDEPWDSETNKSLTVEMPDIFQSKGVELEAGKTLYQLPIGVGTAFEDSKGLALPEFTDGSSNTFLILEVSPDRAVFWTQPEDYATDPKKPREGLGGVQPDGFRAALADGTVRTIPPSTTEDAINGMMTRNGGEAIAP